MEKEEVAKTALDTLAGFASSISQTLKELAPEVWRIIVRQQYAEAAAGLLLVVICYVAAVLICKEAKKFWAKYMAGQSDNDWQILSVVCYAIAGMLLIVATIKGVEVVKMLINPEYYAIKELMNLSK